MKYGSTEQLRDLINNLRCAILLFENLKGKHIPIVVGAELRTHKIKIGRIKQVIFKI
jgi:hypothetical protein